MKIPVNMFIETIQRFAQPLHNRHQDFDNLINSIGDSSVVLLGESTHGTQEFYALRAEITRRLITEKGFSIVAIEGDFPDAYQVNRYIQTSKAATPVEHALDGFRRFPTWMWRNTEMVEFITWLYAYNWRQPEKREKVGFYGLDLYSLHASMSAVVEYLDAIDPEAGKKARKRYDCFERHGSDLQHYGFFAMLDIANSCQGAVIQQLRDLSVNAHKYLSQDTADALTKENYFVAEQNALVVKDAEHYYRSLFEGSDAHSWNIRDKHMMQTLNNCIQFKQEQGDPGKAIVWAHNSHVGNARVTSMGQRGEINIGQLTREQFGDKVFSVGFTTSTGTVTAASNWGGAVERKTIRQPLPGSCEEIFQSAKIPAFILHLKTAELKALFQEPLLQRAIGVMYKPETERWSHYFETILSEQFDAIIHVDETHALELLDKSLHWRKPHENVQEEDLPDTYPFGV